ncbi:MAG: type II secretion system F family protein [Verrucomicrobiota bacterium]
MPFIVTPRHLTLRSELYHQLGSMTAAGLGLPDAMRALSRNPPTRSFSNPLKQAVEYIEEGYSFAEAMFKLGQWMPAFDLALLHAGEKSGRLPQCFQMLSDYYRERAELANSVINALIYPAFLVHFAFLIFPVNGLVGLILRGETFPFLLQKLLFFGPLYAFVFFTLYLGQARHGEQWRAILEGVMHVVPVLGTARRGLALARLSAALEALVSAGVSIIEAWDLAASASGSPALKRAVKAWKPSVEAGQRPSEEISRARDFPELFANLYYSGEISGKLDETLRRLHNLYQEEGVRKMRAFTRALTTAIILCVMIAIGYQIISFYAGYFGQIREAMPE